MVVHRPLPSFALAVSQLNAFSDESATKRDSGHSVSPSSERGDDLMKTFDCRTESVYDSDDDDDDEGDDYWKFKQQASSDYERYCNGYYDDDTDTQTLFDEPMPMSYGVKLTRQSPHHCSSNSKKTSAGASKCESDRQRSNSLRKVPAAWKNMVKKITRTKTA